MFIVGLAREPCSYYVSLFFWGITGWASGKPSGTGWLMHTLRKKGQAELYDINKPGGPRKAFSRWVRAMSDTRGHLPHPANQTCGPLSARLWSAVVNPTAGRALNKPGCQIDPRNVRVKGSDICPCPLSDCASSMTIESHVQCRKEVRAFDLSASPQCWVHLEHNNEDLTECLRKYENATTRRATYRAQTQHRRQAMGIPPRQARKSARRSPHEKKKLIHNTIKNTNDHPECSDVVEPETARYIMDMEKDYADKFGYTGMCCGVPYSESWPQKGTREPSDLFQRT